jgi:ubiquinone/menaquinone biosynthesis C-methylase UbiE
VQSRHWEQHAEEWARWAREPGHDTYWRFHRDAFFELVPPPGRLTVDLGCGEGRVSRDLRALGHIVLAVDQSPTMVAAAREADRELEVAQADAAQLPLEDAAADLVIAFMSLMNAEDLDGVVREAGRVLERGGRLCFAIVHPVNTAGRFISEEPDAPFVVRDSYFEHVDVETHVEKSGLTMTFLDRHRPLQDYSRALEDAGFLIEAIREIPNTEDPPELEAQLRWRRIPLFLDVRAVKA